MEKYVYVSPKELGYRKIDINREEHNEIFPNRRVNIFNRVEYYVNDKKEEVIIEVYINFLGKLVVLLALPISILLYGLVNVKEELLGVFNQRNTGSFVSMTGFQREYNELMRYLEGDRI